MNEKKYSVDEIDALRVAVGNKWLWGNYSLRFNRGGMSRSYTEVEKINSVEQMVRTHMLAGHTANDLYASEQPTGD